MLLDSTEVKHKRDVYNFLFVLADFGGVQLILTVIVSAITATANDRISMFKILQDTFYIRAKDASMIQEGSKAKGLGEDDIYEF